MNAALGLLLLTALLGPARANFVDEFIKNALDKLRPHLKDVYKDTAQLSKSYSSGIALGFDKLHPSLIDVYKETAQVSNLTLTNLTIQGMDSFYTTSTIASILPLKLKNLTIVIDEVTAQSKYSMQGLVLPIGPIALTGAGDLSLRILGIELYLQASLSSYASKLSIKDIQDISIHARDIEISITGLAGGGSVGQLMNDIIAKVARPTFNILATPALMDNRAQLKDIINQVVSLTG